MGSYGFVTERLRSRETRRLRTGAAFLAVPAYGFWFTDRQPFTGGAELALLVPVILLVAIAQARRVRTRRRGASVALIQEPRPVRRFRLAVAVWSSIAVTATAWELFALRSSPRSAHPTISSLVESIEQYHSGRVLLFFAWLWLGWTLAS
jgi:hypothetical protein